MFSSQYPSEFTIPNELAVVAPHFEKVLYLPSAMRASGDSGPELPSNVELVDIVERSSRQRRVRDIPLALAAVTAAAGRRGNLRAYLQNARAYAGVSRRQHALARGLASFVVHRGLRDAVFYDYWFENSTLALALLKERGTIRRAVARVHRFDLYDDPVRRWLIPFRERKVAALDRIVAISEHGRAYLTNKLAPALRDRVVLSRLGVVNQELGPTPQDELLVISASHLQPFKQVHLIPRMLFHVKTPLHWIHFGSGPMMDETRRHAASLPPHIKWELRGAIPHADILRFYREHAVSMFLSLSAEEGLPISMMEAASFGIPMMGYGVCGIPEIIDTTRGALLDPGWPLDRIGAELDSALNGRGFDRKAIAAFQRERFNIQRNYEHFVDILKSL